MILSNSHNSPFTMMVSKMLANSCEKYLEELAALKLAHRTPFSNCGKCGSAVPCLIGESVACGAHVFSQCWKCSPEKCCESLLRESGCSPKFIYKNKRRIVGEFILSQRTRRHPIIQAIQKKCPSNWLFLSPGYPASDAVGQFLSLHPFGQVVEAEFRDSIMSINWSYPIMGQKETKMKSILWI